MVGAMTCQSSSLTWMHHNQSQERQCQHETLPSVYGPHGLTLTAASLSPFFAFFFLQSHHQHYNYVLPRCITASAASLRHETPFLRHFLSPVSVPIHPCPRSFPAHHLHGASIPAGETIGQAAHFTSYEQGGKEHVVQGNAEAWKAAQAQAAENAVPSGEEVQVWVLPNYVSDNRPGPWRWGLTALLSHGASCPIQSRRLESYSQAVPHNLDSASVLPCLAGHHCSSAGQVPPSPCLVAFTHNVH